MNRKPPLSVEVACSDCDKRWSKRKDTVAAWQGRCKSCASKLVANMPHVKQAQIANGIAVMRRVGKLPHPPDKVRRGAQVNTWRGGITPANILARNSPRNAIWKKAVFERDGYACVLCGGGEHNLPALMSIKKCNGTNWVMQ